MKRSTIVLLTIFTIIITTMTVQPASAQSKKVKEVTLKVEELRKAMISADGAVLNHLASDSLTYGHSNGLLEDKAQFVENFTSKTSVFVSIELSEQTIKIIGNTAIIRHILSAATNDKGKGSATVHLKVLQVWVKSGSEWQLVARQAVKII